MIIVEQQSRNTKRKQSGFNVKGQALTSISRLQTYTDRSLRDVEFSKNDARMLTGGRRWQSEEVSGLFFLTVDSLCDVWKLGYMIKFSSLDMSLIPVTETEALPAEQDRNKHDTDWQIELGAPRVKEGPRDPTDDEVTWRELWHMPIRSGIPICIAAPGTDDPCCRRGETERNDPQLQLDFLFLTDTATNKDALEEMSHFVRASLK